MKGLHLLGAVTAAGAIALMPVAEASAAALANGTYNAYRYDHFARPLPQNAQEHAFWLPGLSGALGLGSNTDWIFDNPSTTPIREFGTLTLSDTSLTLSGRIFYEDDADAYWDLNLSFTPRPITQPATPKGPGNAPSAADLADWRYFNLVEPGVLTGGGDLAGLFVDLTQRPVPSPGSHATQIGFGANDKNSSAGMSTWLNWSLRGTNYSGRGDINLVLEPGPPEDVPEPFTILGTLIAAGSGATALKRKRSTEV